MIEPDQTVQALQGSKNTYNKVTLVCFQVKCPMISASCLPREGEI